ncbi:unnamed protein product [Symbiodinium sp. CCMP2456]|nr:unnamed protein product [Symbiodinium sp. CCMP2456]
MVSLLKSEAAFEARAKDCGLPGEEIERLKTAGIVNISLLAFATSAPGTPPSEDQLRNLLRPLNPESVGVGTLAALRHLMFECQTLCLAHVKASVEGTDKKVELVPAERSARIASQKDSPMYLEPHRFDTRAAEVAREKPGKELVLDQNKISVKDRSDRGKCAIQDALSLHQALQRRALACDLMSACSYEVLHEWHSFMLERLQQQPPPGCAKPSIEQILRADRIAWVRLAERVHSLRRTASGALPLDAAIADLNRDPTVLFHLLPSRETKAPERPQRDPSKKDDDKKRKIDDKKKVKPDSTKVQKSEMPDELRRRLVPDMRLHPALVLTAMVRRCAPSHSFTSLNLFLNVKTALHIDVNNEQLPNIIIGISDFRGGQVLVENPKGSHTTSTASGDVRADLLEVAGTHAVFDAYRLRHETVDWIGDRLVLVAFSVKGSHLLCPADRTELLKQGFVLPSMSECSTNDPPAKSLACDPSCLPSGLKDRCHDKCLGDMLFLEIFCGTGGLAAAVKKVGIGASVGVSARVTGRTKCSVVPLNLLDPSQHPLLWDMLKRDNIAAVHMSPPQSQDALNSLCTEVIEWCQRAGILLVIENPTASKLWQGPVGNKCKAFGFLKTTLHQCMFGAAHPKHSALFHNFPEVRRLCLVCDGQHQHAPWDSSTDGPISAYPLAMCQSLAHAIRDRLVLSGCATSCPHVSLSRAAQAATGKQPKGSRIPPLVPPRAGFVVLRGPGCFMPPTGVLKQFTPLSSELSALPPVHGLPAGSKCTRSVLYRG